MFLLFEEAGKFLAGSGAVGDGVVGPGGARQRQAGQGQGRQLSCSSSTSRHRPSCWPAAREVSESIELEMAWEFAPEDEFGFADLARDYFSDKADAGAAGRRADPPVRGAALLPPRRQGALSQGRRRRAGAGAGSDREEEAGCSCRSTQWVDRAERRPVPGADSRAALQDLVQAGQERARVQGGGRGLARHPPGAAGTAAKGRRDRFAVPVPLAPLPVRELPQGHRFSCAAGPADPGRAAAVAGVSAFSIDDSATTEIDDALVGAGPGQRARSRSASTSPRPGLAMQPGDPIDQLGRARLSTVYMPGYKVTMLPDDVVQTYTLQEGRDCPAVSLYVTFDEATLAIEHSATRLERVPIVANLRHDQLDTVVTDAVAAADPQLRHATDHDALLPELRAQLSFLHRLATAPEGAARGGARQARDLQPAGLQLPAARQGDRRSPTAANRCRSRCASAAHRWT